jgi:hypothetical protein
MNSTKLPLLPVKAGIQENWIPAQGRHDQATKKPMPSSITRQGYFSFLKKISAKASILPFLFPAREWFPQG